MDEDIPPVATTDGWGFLQLPWRVVEQLPWLEEGSMAAALAGVALLIFVVVIAPALVVYVSARIRDTRLRRREQARRDAILSTYASLPEESVKHLSVRQGVLTARAALLDTFTREWEELREVMPGLLNSAIVEETRSRIEETWSAPRRRQFYLRYHFPLAVVLNPRRWEALFGTTNSVPTVCGVGETDAGMYVIVSTAPGWTRHEWDDILPDLRIELDAPDASVEIVNSSEVIIALNDRAIRPPHYPDDPEYLRSAADASESSLV